MIKIANNLINLIRKQAQNPSDDAMDSLLGVGQGQRMPPELPEKPISIPFASEINRNADAFNQGAQKFVERIPQGPRFFRRDLNQEISRLNNNMFQASKATDKIRNDFNNPNPEYPLSNFRADMDAGVAAMNERGPAVLSTATDAINAGRSQIPNYVEQVRDAAPEVGNMFSNFLNLYKNQLSTANDSQIQEYLGEAQQGLGRGIQAANDSLRSPQGQAFMAALPSSTNPLFSEEQGSILENSYDITKDKLERKHSPFNNTMNAEQNQLEQNLRSKYDNLRQQLGSRIELPKLPTNDEARNMFNRGIEAIGDEMPRTPPTAEQLQSHLDELKNKDPDNYSRPIR